MQCKVITSTLDLAHDAWLSERDKGIGGSDAGIIMGVSPYKSRFGLYAEKVGTIVNDFQGNEATEWGHALERPVAERYAATTQNAVVAYPAMLQHGLHDCLLANVDFFIVEPSEAFPAGVVTDVVPVKDEATGEWNLPHAIAILEIKTSGIVGHGNARQWEGDGVPAGYVWQGAHYALVTGVHHVVYAALIGGHGLQIRDRVFTGSILENLMREELAFWDSVEGRAPAPDPTGADSDFDALKSLYPVSEAEVVEATAEVAEALGKYRRIKAQVTELESALKEHRATVEAHLGSADTLVDAAGNVMATFKSNKETATVDTKRLLAEHPELADEYKTTRAGARVLRVKDNA